MPLIKVQSSVAAPAVGSVEEMLKGLSASLAKHTGKPESYVMTTFEPEVSMTFGGSTEPACYVEVKSVGAFSADQTRVMSKDLCQQVSKALGVAGNRIYIEFADAKGYMWGWNGSTFG